MALGPVSAAPDGDPTFVGNWARGDGKTRIRVEPRGGVLRRQHLGRALADLQVRKVVSPKRTHVISGRVRFVGKGAHGLRMPGLRTLVIAYLVTFAAFCGLDFFWLSFAAETIYRPAIGELLRQGFDAPAAVAFYLIYVFGLVFLAIRPAARLTQALTRGAVYGFSAYATYDLTNQATLRSWPLKLSLVDMAWGTALSAVAAACGYLALAMASRSQAGAAGAARTR